jgi:hypothetical protein
MGRGRHASNLPMRDETALLPRSLSAPRISARVWLALAAGAGSAVCAYAGLYPRFDSGALRIIVALTSAPFAAAVLAASTDVKAPEKAFGRAVGLAVVLGMASTVIPSAILAGHGGGGGAFLFACAFGAFFGGGTGLVYGVPLGILASSGYRHVAAQTHDGTDRAARVAGIWLFVVSLIGVAGTSLLDQPTMDYATDAMTEPSRVPALVGSVIALAGVIVFVRATRRLRLRHAWIARVRAGREPAFRLRHADLRDRMDGLPRLGTGSTVVELVADAAAQPMAGAAYRVAASGVAVAIVDDELSMVA